MTVGGVYAIHNVTTEKRYVGSTVNLRRRLREHFRHLTAGVHRSVKLQRSWDKHGAAAFVIEHLEIVDDPSRLVEYEQFWIDLFDSALDGYNVSPTAGSQLGRVCSEETKAKIAAKARGRLVTAETRAKMSAIHRGRPRPPRVIEAMAAVNRGRPLSEERRAKMSASLKGRIDSPETRAKKSQSRRGLKHSPETRAKIGASHKALRAARPASSPKY